MITEGYTCVDIAIATSLIAKDYRKASEVVEEIYKAFREEMHRLIGINEKMYAEDEYEYYEGRIDAYLNAINCLAELKKKYTENKGE
jgi:hypothetical protein